MKPFLLLSVRPETDAVRAEYRSTLIASGLSEPELEHHRLDLASLPAGITDRYAGVLIGGSPFNLTTPSAEKTDTQLRVEADLARLAETALDQDFPILFTCYGIGALAQVLGGEVNHRYAEPVGAVQITLTDAGRADALTGVLPESFTALAGHKEAVAAVPPGAVLLGSSEACPVQMFRVGRNVYATQFHPELTTDDLLARALVYRDYGYFPAEAYSQIVTQVSGISVTWPRLLLTRFVELQRQSFS